MVALTSANEGTPVTVIEAQAAGMPVVSTDVGGVRDIVADGVSGFVVPPGDMDAIAEPAARRLAARPELRAPIRRGAAAARATGIRTAPRRTTSTPSTESCSRAAREERGPLTAPQSRSRALCRRTTGDAAPAARRLRIVLVSQYFPPEVGATQSRMQAFAEYLAARGHDVTVICEFPNHPHGVIPPEYRGKLVEDDRSNPYRVLRVWVQGASPRRRR